MNVSQNIFFVYITGKEWFFSKIKLDNTGKTKFNRFFFNCRLSESFKFVDGFVVFCEGGVSVVLLILIPL